MEQSGQAGEADALLLQTKANGGNQQNIVVKQDSPSSIQKTKSNPDVTKDSSQLLANGSNGQISQSQPLLNAEKTECDIAVKSEENAIVNKEGSVLSFHNLRYKVQVPAQGARCCSCKKEDKHILKDISGICRPGMNAILGPTGSGKTSLLDVLAGRKDPAGVTGSVLVDGHKQPQNFKCQTGYVIQDDIVVSMLTVRENIHFSAALRLPGTVSEDQRRGRVEDVIAELGLADCANSMIGTPLRRGVSGGERKRTNIAMELITAPPVLFLDEPTTGLDATTAYSVMCQLQKLSQSGTTIIFSIHQPRYAIYKLFQNMLLLSQGEVVYQGPAGEALDYFRSIGYHCEEHNNPPDFFLDVLNDMVVPVNDVTQEQDQVTNYKSSEFGEMILAIEGDADSSESDRTHRSLVSKFQTSEWNQRIVDELKPIEEAHVTGTDVTVPSVGYATSVCKQLQIVGARTFRELIRNFHTLTTQVISAIILAVLVGSIYFQVDEGKAGLQNRVGAFFFITMNFVFSNMTAMDIFLKDRVVFIHENISGYYRVSVYFLSKLLCDVIPQRLLPTFVFATISYWMIGLSPDVVKYLTFSLTVFLTSLAGTSVALVFSATVQTGSIGSLFTALVWVLMMVFSGLLVNVETVPRFLQWIKWISIFRYSMNAFSVNELTDLTFCVNNATSTCESGAEYMERQSIPYGRTWDLWFNELMLVVIATAFLVLTYVQLRRLNKIN